MKDLQNAENNSKSGFIPLSRKLFEHPFWKQKRVFSYAEAWIDLVQKARFEQKPGECIIKNELVSFNRGELVIAQRILSQNWGWSTSRLRRFLCILCDESMISLRQTKVTRTTIITICNYATYNPESNTEKEEKKHERNANETQTTHERPNTNKDNKEKNRESNALPQNEEYKKFLAWMNENTPYCTNHKNFPEGITEQNFLKLRGQYSKTQITDMMLRIENRRDLRRRYSNLYLTLLNWLKKENHHGN